METISVDEAAQLLKCEPQTVMSELRGGTLPGVKFGREWVIPRDAFFARLNEMALTEASARRTPKAPEVVPVKRRRAPPAGFVQNERKG